VTHRYSRWLALLMLIPATGWACRCAQQTLAEYFDAADEVVFARLVHSVDHEKHRELTFDLMVPAHKTSRKLVPGSRIDYRTALSTAACGVQPVIDGIYIVFASKHDDNNALWVDSCSGTRAHLLPGSNEAQGFMDVPARFVAGQLNALAGLDVLRKVSAHAPNASDPDNTSLIGLLDLKALAHGGNTLLYADRDKSAAPVARIVEYSQLESEEFGYEQAGAIVYSFVDDWYRVRQKSGAFAWVDASDTGTFMGYASLPVRRLNYATENWSGFVWPDPGAGVPQRVLRGDVSDAGEYPINVLESTIIGGMPWFRIEVLDSEPCTSAEPRSKAAGWIPGYGQNGQRTVWFYSRGC